MSDRAWWVLCPDGIAHLPMLDGPELLITRCQRSLPPELGQCGGVPEGRRRCPECFASLAGRARASREPRAPVLMPISAPYPQSFLDRVAEEVAVRAVLREVITLATQSSVLTDPQVQARLIVLAGTARSGCHECRSADEAPAAHRSSVTPGGQLAPGDPGTVTQPSCTDSADGRTTP